MILMKPHFFGGSILLVISEILMSQGIEPFATHFYSFAWWSYILIIDSIIYKFTQNSYLINRRKNFAVLIPWSIAFWLIFELFNLKLNNWHYINLSIPTSVRWTGYTIAYATVLPGLFETYELLRVTGLYQRFGNLKKRVLLTTRDHFFLFFTGIFCLAAPLFFPKYFFPTVWLGFIFLLEPVNYRWGGISLIKDWEEGNFREVLLLFTAGLICGMLWEFWNFWAKAKWIYTIPLFNSLKIFEMPLLGYLGFAPFAVECYVMYNFISRLLGLGLNPKGHHTRETTLKPPTQILLYLVLIFFFLLMYNLIDLYTVKS